MKKYDYIFLSLGILLSIPTIYTFFGWVYIFETHPELTQLEKVAVYDSEIMFNFFKEEKVEIVVILLFGLISSLLLLKSLIISHEKKNKYLIFRLIFFTLNAIATFSLVFGLM